MRSLVVGYLHLGPENHGVRRFGEMLAAAARQHPMLSVSEVAVAWHPNQRRNTRLLLDAARKLRNVEVIHVQYNAQREKSTWGRGWRQLYHLALFLRTCRRPIVVSVHDTYPRTSFGAVLKHALSTAVAWARHGARLPNKLAEEQAVLSPGSFISQIKRVMGPDGVSLLWLNRRAHALIVCSHEERARLDSFFGAPVVRVIPHFVESRTMPPVTGQEAKQHCGLAGHRVVTLLGFIHPRKGHGMLLDALKHLPEDIVAVFAGGARDERIVNNLRALATDLGVSHRVRITGYLDEGTLGYYLAATDLAVCPFADVAASSSLATWISAARPVLASDLPLIAEYNRIETGAIGVFSPYSAPALAAAILSALKQPEMPVVAAIQRLRQQLEISSIIDRHRLLYEDVAQKNKGRRGTPN